MARVEVPEIKFSRWIPWNRRLDEVQRNGPWLGVYIWARFPQPPSRKTRPYPRLPSQLIYVGETKHVDERPLTGAHHRLRHYRDTFPHDRDLRELYVSVYRVHPFRRGYDSKKARGLYARLRVFTQYIEGKIYWDYTKKWGRPPALHYKKGTYGHD